MSMSGLERPDKGLYAGKYRDLLLFAAKALGIFLTFLLLKVIHRFLIDPEFDFFLSAWLRDLNLYFLLTKTILYPSQWILDLLGYDTKIGPRVITIIGYRGIIINAPCLGIEVMAVFAALIASFPSNAGFRRKTLFIMAGVLGIHLLNILRVTALALKNRYSYPLPFDHHDLFNIVIYTFVFLTFYYWTKRSSRYALNPGKFTS